MNQLNLKIMGGNYLTNAVLLVDDHPTPIKKNQFASRIATYKTDKEKVNIKLVTYLDHGGIIWFLTQLFFFVISIFGLFDTHEKQSYQVLDYEADVTLQGDTTLTLQYRPKSDTGAIEIKSGQEFVSEKNNSCMIHQKAKKTRKILLLSKIILAIVIIVAIVLGVINHFK